MTAFCPHCDSELGGHLVLTADWHSFRSYWCREHGDVVPRDDWDEERMQGNLSDVQNDIFGAGGSRHRERQDSLPE